MLDMVSSLVMIAAVAIATFATRAALVYCLRSTQVFAYPYGLPELIACLAVIGLHAWRRNVLLSVGAGTVLYMILVQMVFV